MTDSYCDVDFSGESSDAEEVDFFVRASPIARKDHVCCECKEPIGKGERYHRISYKFEGQLQCDRLCASCHEATGEFEYYIFGGDFWRHMREQWEYGANVQGCINRLTTVKAKNLMHRQWMKWKGLK